MRGKPVTFATMVLAEGDTGRTVYGVFRGVLRRRTPTSPGFIGLGACPRNGWITHNHARGYHTCLAGRATIGIFIQHDESISGIFDFSDTLLGKGLVRVGTVEHARGEPPADYLEMARRFEAPEWPAFAWDGEEAGR